MQLHAPRLLTALTTCTLTFSTLAAEPLTIAELAPPGSIMVAGVDNAAALWESFDRTGFAALWAEPEFKKWLERQTKDTMEELTGTLEALDIKMEDLKRPSGPFGLAAWYPADADPEAPPQVLIVADYGADAESMHEQITKALEKGQEKNKATYKETVHDGVDIYTYTLTDAAGIAEGMADELGDDEMNPLGGLDGSFVYPEMHYARAEQVLILASSMDSIERAIDRVKGEEGTGIEESAEFTAARAQHPGAQGYAVILGEAGRTWLKSTVENLPDEDFGPSFVNMLGVLGLNEISSASIGIRFDSDEADLEQSYAVLAAKKTGLVALPDAPGARFTPPPFIGADAASISTFNFNFSGLLPLVNQAVATLPDEVQAQAGGMIMGISMSLGPILANIGPEVVASTRYERPFGPSSEQTIWAIKVRDAAVLQQALAGLLPSFGFESRDFQGNQIWSSGPGGMLPAGSMALGLGFGYFFIGPAEVVENSMRSAGAADSPRLSDEEHFTFATRALDDAGIAYSYNNFATALEWFEWTSKNYEKLLREQLTELWGNEPPADDEEKQWREDALREALESQPAWMKDLPPLDLMRKHIGDTVTQIKSTPAGYTGRSLSIRPKAE